MSIKERLEQDIKQAMLSGDKTLVTTLRGLKSAILYVEVAKGSREQGLTDAEIIDVFSKEAKKRQESADMYRQGGSQERADAEAAEKVVIEKYLPTQMSDEELADIIQEITTNYIDLSPQFMGKVIAEVKQKTQGRADGGRIAAAVKENMNS